jgi:hypothetical protein
MVGFPANTCPKGLSANEACVWPHHAEPRRNASRIGRHRKKEAAVNLDTGWTDLNAALKTLREHWANIQIQWDDVVRQDFEDHFWVPLEDQVRATLRGIERLSPVLVQVQKDCG